jgi:undecaprenyl-phosphate 4-deoxy-4-formamido-L-arabinose transferase
LLKTKDRSVPATSVPDNLLQAQSACDVSVVIPVYNSAPMLATLIQRLRAALDPLRLDYEIVLVDDGSSDGSWAALEQARTESGERLVAIQLMRNYGQHNALMCGLRHARGRVVVTMDDDLQNPPEEIPKLLDWLEQTQADVVYGVPAQREHGAWRNLGSAVVLHFYRFVFKNQVTPTSFRAIRRELVDSVQFYDLNFTFLDGLLAWCSQRIDAVEVTHQLRAQGRSGYSLSRLLALALNLYTNFSLLPLQLVSTVGLLSAVAGFGVGLYFLVLSVTAGIAVPGYASTIIAILILGGAQMLALGIIGEYLGRLHMNVNKKPQYIVRHLRPRNQGSTHTRRDDEALPGL